MIVREKYRKPGIRYKDVADIAFRWLIIGAIVVFYVVAIWSIYKGQLERSREDADIAAAQAAFNEMVQAAEGNDSSSVSSWGNDIWVTTIDPISQQVDGWQQSIDTVWIGHTSPSDKSNWRGVPVAGGKCTIIYNKATDTTTVIWGKNSETEK